ncbi:MAG: hypothetical protein CL534_17505 [Ahrensia sp.]|nr:hypothetical protein [Ahrensia sp.]
MATSGVVVILGLDPGIHGQEALNVMAGWWRIAGLDGFLTCSDRSVPRPWILGSSPRMTEEGMGFEASHGLRGFHRIATCGSQSVPDTGD